MKVFKHPMMPLAATGLLTAALVTSQWSQISSAQDGNVQAHGGAGLWKSCVGGDCHDTASGLDDDDKKMLMVARSAAVAAVVLLVVMMALRRWSPRHRQLARWAGILAVLSGAAALVAWNQIKAGGKMGWSSGLQIGGVLAAAGALWFNRRK